MKIIITPSDLSGSVKAIASKSYAHRLIICSALADKETSIGCPESSDDIEATVRCLNALGAHIERTETGYDVTPLSKECLQKNAILDCGESGSTLRFLLPVVCALQVNASFILGGRLPQRPMFPLIEALGKNGCRFSGVGNPILNIYGGLKSGSFSLPGNISSQFISGLLLALPLLTGGGEIEVTGGVESENYISMTVSALEAFGVKVETAGDRLITEGSKYVSPTSVAIEGDWSNAAFWLAAGAIGKSEIECTDINTVSLQGDREVLGILKKFGAEITTSFSSVSVKPGKLRGTEIDASNIPDLVPILAVIGSVSEGKTEIKNASRLRMKESDRLQTVTEMLKTLGANIEETADGLTILGKARLKGGTVDSCGDHRIAMAAAIASIVCENPVKIDNAEAVNKSYPGFFEDFVALGGIIRKEGT